jgi:hypothetical protein
MYSNYRESITMAKQITNSVVAVFESHGAAEDAIREL